MTEADFTRQAAALVAEHDGSDPEVPVERLAELIDAAVPEQRRASESMDA